MNDWERHVTKEGSTRRFALSDMTDDELLACSTAMSIGLSLEEMKDARDYFAGRGQDATDVEMEALGQAWSEHCCYKSSKPVLQRNVYGIAEDQIVDRSDAGIVEFDENYYYAVGLESHNHPSAVEPYGGAATGVGGILRDVVCMGAQPVALVDPLFFGPLDKKNSDLPAGVKHPSFIMQGVVSGIRDYGNRVGIPTVAGGVTFHEGYTGNCLVNVGCIGLVKKDRVMPSKAGGVGDVFVYLGNSTGRDGIHGVAFASEELTEDSEEDARPAVQVGDAILKEPLIHVTLELIENNLVTGCKDFGGGGLSCVAGELAYDAGFGCEIWLEKIPTKVPGMQPWEIWVSESQERMMVTCKEDQVERILQIATKWDVQAEVVGRVIEEKVNRVTFDGQKVLELDLEFSTGGPVYNRPVGDAPEQTVVPVDLGTLDHEATLRKLMAHPSIMSKEWVIRQYDHEVRANTVLKPLQGVIGSEGPGDATVLKPALDSDKGLALVSDINPRLTERDPYWGSASGVDEVVRNLAAVGARISSLCDNLNFGNPQKPERMRELEDSTRGLGDMARALNVPFSSGNVSLYNETPQGPIPPTPTLMGVGILSHYQHATTLDLKQAGNVLYLLGETHEEFGGSAVTDTLGLDGGKVPETQVQTLIASAEAVVQAIEAGQVRAAHDLAEGGLAVALAEMAFAGQLGAQVDVSAVHDELNIALYSESNTRWLLEVRADQAEAFEALVAKLTDAPLLRLGSVTEEPKLTIEASGTHVVNLPVNELRDIWAHALPKLLGVEA